MNKLFFSLVVLAALLTGCENKSATDGLSVTLTDTGANFFVGKAVDCSLSFSNYEEGSVLPVSFTVEGAAGFLTVGGKHYEAGEVFDCDARNVLITYIPTEKGQHSLTFTTITSGKTYAGLLDIQVDESKLNVDIEGLKSSVPVGQIGSFRIVLDTDIDSVFCTAHISKGSGTLTIAGQEVASGKIISLKTDNEVQITPFVPGTIMMNFRIYGSYGKEVGYIVGMVAE